MKVALELELAKRMRTATRWVEGQQGRLPSDDADISDGFGRMMLVQTGALPKGYHGGMELPGMVLHRTAGAAEFGADVLIKDEANRPLLPWQTHFGRLGGFSNGKALYFVIVGANSVATGYILPNQNGRLLYGDDGVVYIPQTTEPGAWWQRMPEMLGCAFTRISGISVAVIRTDSMLYSGWAIRSISSIYSGTYEVYSISSGPRYQGARIAFASDPLGIAAHMTQDRKEGGPPAIFRAIVSFSSSSYRSYPTPVGVSEGIIISVASPGWPKPGVDPVNLVGYSPFWDGVKSTNTIGEPLGVL